MSRLSLSPDAGWRCAPGYWHRTTGPSTLDLRELIGQIRMGMAMPISALASAGREISLCYAAAINECLVVAGAAAGDLAAVAAHGQTLYHDPPNTIQWLDPALVAAEVGCAVVSDFRRADCAAGGQGAPLVPMADYLLFRDAKKNRVLLNIGGIANLTFLPADCGIDSLIAFDTGPGNCLSDHLVRHSRPARIGWDEGGRLAQSGVPIYPLVTLVLSSPYFAQSPPKSTDGPAMIKLFTDAQAAMGRRYPLEYLLRSACLIAADAILESMRKFLKPFPDEIIVSGGGTKNQVLMECSASRWGTEWSKRSRRLESHPRRRRRWRLRCWVRRRWTDCREMCRGQPGRAGPWCWGR